MSLSLSLSLSLAPPAHAGEPSEKQKEAAEKLFVEGRDADARGERELACAKFRSSVALFPVPNAVANVARCAEREGRAVEALLAWQQVIALLPPGDNRIALAQARAAALAAKVPRITLILPSDLPAHARISIDDTPTSRDAWGSPILLTPGDHVIVVEAPGREDRRFTVTLSDGDQKDLAVSAAPPPAAPPPIVVQGPSKPDGRRAAAFAVGGLGLAGFIAAGITGGVLISRDARTRDLCPSKVCTPEGWQEIAGSKPLLVVNGISWGVGIAGASVAAVLLLTGRSSAPTKTAILPLVIPGGAGISVGGSF